MCTVACPDRCARWCSLQIHDLQRQLIQPLQSEARTEAPTLPATTGRGKSLRRAERGVPLTVRISGTAMHQALLTTCHTMIVFFLPALPAPSD